MPKSVSSCAPRSAHLRLASVLLVAATACSDDPPATGAADAKVAVASAALTVDATDLSGWTEAGELDWREEATSITDPSGSYPASGSGLPVLHASDCDAECRISQNDSLDLTMAESATLTFLRYVDVSLD